MSGLALPIFPEGSIASAVTTTVWVGVWVVVFFNLRLGWNASGLVVPGYLVPLLLIKPVAAAVVLGEGVLTYLIVKLICSGREVKPWTSFFGRDRFFAMLVVTIMVRCVLDGWALPWLADLVTRRFEWQLAFQDDLHSFGLIIVSLVANYFWKPGIRRGAVPLAITIGATFLIVRVVLIEGTNFNVGNLQYMYEDIATSLLASPKAYIVLITTAYIASWMNLHYGWEFSGILIPALLALQWHLPWKILTTFVETFLILGIASLILRVPPFSRTNMEGSRKTLLFFNIAFAFRLLLGHVVPEWFPSIKVTDLYGFGYLLSTLLAVRIHAMGILLRVPRVSIQVSMVGALVGSILGFAMTLVPGAWIWSSERSLTAEGTATQRVDRTVVDWVRAEKPRLYRQRLPESFVVPTVADLTRFGEGVDLLVTARRSGGTETDFDRARNLLRQANYDLRRIEDRYWVLAELEPARGWGMYVIDSKRPGGLLIEVPAPIDEWAIAESGTALLLRLEGGALAIGGSGLKTNRDGASDVLNRPRTIFATFHRALARGNVLQIRGLTASVRRHLGEVSEYQEVIESSKSKTKNDLEPSTLWIKGSLPKGLDLRRLETTLGSFPILWRPTPLPSTLRDSSWSRHAELVLTMRDRARLQSAMIVQGADAPTDTGLLTPRPARLGARLLDLKEQILPEGVGNFQLPAAEILLYFDEEVLRPLTSIAMSGRGFDALADEQRDRITAAANAAGVLGYRLQVVHDISNDADFLLLFEESGIYETASDEDPSPASGKEFPDATPSIGLHGWGTYVFRLGRATDYTIEVPRPLVEQQTYEYGVSLFESIEARMLMLAGAHPRANPDHSSDVTRAARAANLFNLARQVVLREADARPWRQVQVRASKMPGDHDILLAPADPTINVGVWFEAVLDHLRHQQLSVGNVDGAQETAGYEFDNLFLKQALRLSTNGQALLLWLAPNVRRYYRQQDEDTLQAARFTALGVPTVETALIEYLAAMSDVRPMRLSGDVRATLAAYLDTRDIVILRDLQRRWPAADWTRVLDADTARAFLVVRADNAVWVLRLAEQTTDIPGPFESADLSRTTIERFANSRGAWLEGEEAP